MYDLGDFGGGGLGEERSEADNVDEFTEVNEENGNRSAVNTSSDGPQSHQNAVVEVSECEQFQ